MKQRRDDLYLVDCCVTGRWRDSRDRGGQGRGDQVAGLFDVVREDGGGGGRMAIKSGRRREPAVVGRGRGRGQGHGRGRGRGRDVIDGGERGLDAEGRGDTDPPDFVEEERGCGEDGGSGRGRACGEAVKVGRGRGHGGRGRGGRGRTDRGHVNGREEEVDHH